MEKLCLFCKHFDYSNIEACKGYNSFGSYPDVTGGNTCKKGHYKNERPYSDEEMRSLYLTAETCEDYERPKEKK